MEGGEELQLPDNQKKKKDKHIMGRVSKERGIFFCNGLFVLPFGSKFIG
jgi:hypothetical protein